MPSPRCGDFGTTSREMSTYKAKHYLKPKCLPENCFALTLRKWNRWLVFYFKKILYTFAKVFHEWQLVFALMEDQWKVFVSWISAFIFWIFRLKNCFTKLSGGRKDGEFRISRSKLLHIGWINNKVLLYSTGNYIQYPVINHNGKEYEKENTYTYNWVTLLYSRN